MSYEHFNALNASISIKTYYLKVVKEFSKDTRLYFLIFKRSTPTN